MPRGRLSPAEGRKWFLSSWNVENNFENHFFNWGVIWKFWYFLSKISIFQIFGKFGPQFWGILKYQLWFIFIWIRSFKYRLGHFQKTMKAWINKPNWFRQFGRHKFFFRIFQKFVKRKNWKKWKSKRFV